MKTLFSMVCVLASAAALAQEIGTEIPPEQSNPGTTRQPTSYDNPYGQPTQPPAPPATPAESAAPAPAVAAEAPGPRKGAFGLRASFGGSGVPVAPTTSGAGGVATPTIGMKYLATDSVGITFDVGTALGIGNRFAFGFGLGFGVEAYLGSADKPIRPFFVGEVDFGKAFSLASDDFFTNLGVGFGAEYWLSPYFSLQGRALVGVPLNFKAMNAISVATFQPGLGANFYF